MLSASQTNWAQPINCLKFVLNPTYFEAKRKQPNAKSARRFNKKPQSPNENKKDQPT